jgi:homogentisate 1,2-dioxygenase
MCGHGPDAATFERASEADTSRPQRLSNTMAFMFETRAPIGPTRYALELPQLQRDYARCWDGLPKRFIAPVSDSRPR